MKARREPSSAAGTGSPSLTSVTAGRRRRIAWASAAGSMKPSLRRIATRMRGVGTVERETAGAWGGVGSGLVTSRASAIVVHVGATSERV